MQNQLKWQGNIFASGRQTEGTYYGTVVQTDASVTDGSITAGNLTFTIPSYSGTQVWGPVPYPGSVAPPVGTSCTVTFTPQNVPVIHGFLGFGNGSGAQGPQGPQGPQGAQGSQGLQGYQGPQGATPSTVGDSGWANVSSFSNGFGSAGTAPAYRLLNNVVYLRGNVTGGSANATAFTLPSGYRPSAATVIMTQNFGTSGYTYVTVNTDGTVVPNASATWLSGIVFPIG